MSSTKTINRVCVYCASSRQAHPDYANAASALGALLAEQNISIIYGGGAVGSMGALADGAISAGGEVIGVLPEFMNELEWGHVGLSDLHIVDDLHQRKRMLLDGVDAVVALAGGSGTMEELTEAITWKRLGIYVNPIIIVNTRDYFRPLLDQFENAINEKFMAPKHRDIWQVVETVDQVVPAIQNAPPWGHDDRRFAAL